MTNPVFVALDTTNIDHAESLARALAPHVGGVKLGLEFFSSHGPSGIARIGRLGLPLFVDVKLHDIPNTVGKASAALAELEPAILTVHASGGADMMRAARDNAHPSTKVVGVTVLTSMDGDDLDSIGVNDGPSAQVDRLAALARSAGLDGIVCSGVEVERAAAAWPGGFFVVPGVRPAGGDVGDQKRVVTPAQALSRGASVLVIGRPITSADNPEAAAAAICAQMKEPLQ